MKRKKSVSAVDLAALRELVRDQPAAVLGVRKEQNKGFSDTPLFSEKNQTSLF